jgi:hypothetical protein
MTFAHRVALALGLLLPVSAVGETLSREEQKADFVAERCAENVDVYIPLQECEAAAARGFEIRQVMRAKNALAAGKSAEEVAKTYGLPVEDASAVESEEPATDSE